jgi:hypothetical protein
MTARLLALSLIAAAAYAQTASTPRTKTESYVRVTMRCDRDVTGSASVNLYATNIYVGVSPTDIFCGDHLVVATTQQADSYAITADLETPDGEVLCSSGLQPLPDRLSCAANPDDPQSQGARFTLHQPK